MKKVFLAMALLVLFSGIGFARDYTATASFTHDGNDVNGNAEQSLPITVNLYIVGTDELKATAQINGAVTNQAMDPFTVTVPDNAVTTVQFYATATDSAGNVSEKGYSNEVQLSGDDTNPPNRIDVHINLQ